MGKNAGRISVDVGITRPEEKTRPTSLDVLSASIPAPEVVSVVNTKAPLGFPKTELPDWSVLHTMLPETFHRIRSRTIVDIATDLASGPIGTTLL